MDSHVRACWQSQVHALQSVHSTRADGFGGGSRRGEAVSLCSAGALHDWQLVRRLFSLANVFWSGFFPYPTSIRALGSSVLSKALGL